MSAADDAEQNKPQTKPQILHAQALAREAERQKLREQRLAAALRENLLRRKAQSRARADGT